MSCVASRPLRAIALVLMMSLGVTCVIHGGVAHAAEVGSTARVSVNSAGAQGNGLCQNPSISGDGRYVAFESDASNLVAGDTNGYSDAFVHDRVSGTTTRVSVNSAGAQEDGTSYSSCGVSADGRYVAFVSNASNLVAGDTNGTSDVFVHDCVSGSTTRVSVDSAGAQGNGDVDTAAISADGRYVVFRADASNLVAGDTNGTWDVFVHDRVSGSTARVSVNSAGAQANGDSSYLSMSASADGRYVAFVSDASNLVAGDTNGTSDVFVHDCVSGSTARVSVNSAGAQGNGDVESAAISADGRYVAFVSNDSNLVAGDTNGDWDAFVRDRVSGTTTRVSVNSTGVQENGGSFTSVVSADGRYVAFVSDASNLVAGDTNGAWDVFVHDRVSGSNARVSVNSAGAQGNGFCQNPSIGGDGRYVAFVSDASNLVAGDTNGTSDVFVHDRGAPVPDGGEVPYVGPTPDQPIPKPAIVLVGGINEDYGFLSPMDSNHPWHDVYDDLTLRGYDVYVVPSFAADTGKTVVNSLGGYTGDNADHVQNYLTMRGLHDRDVIIIGHSMGGLIARKWAASPWLWRPQGLTPKAIIQLGTPNAGSPLPILDRLKTIDFGLNQSLYELDQNTPIIGRFNRDYQNTSGIPILRLGGEFFPDSARHQALSPFSPSQALTNGIIRAAFGLNTANDGAVSSLSLLAGPVIGSRGAIFYPVMHSQSDLLFAFDTGANGFIIPKRDTPVENQILLEISNFVFAVSEGEIHATPAAAKPAASARFLVKTATGLSAAVSDPGSGSAFRSILERLLSLSSSATSTVQFAVEGTSAVAAVQCDGPGLKAVVRAGGRVVGSQVQAMPSGLAFSFATTPGGLYTIELRSGASGVPASVSVLDSGSSALVLDTQSSGAGGSDALVTARLARGSSNLVGSFSASIDGGPAVTMSDNGSGADATASDGVYSAFMRLPASGMASRTTVDATATSGGVTVQRTGFGFTEIVEPRAMITGAPTLSTGVTPSGKVGQVFVDVPVSTSQDCTLQVAADLSSASALMAQSTAQVTLTSGKVTVVRVSFEAADIQGFGNGVSQVLASVKLYDSTDGGLSLLDSDTSGPLSLSGSALALASCTINPLDARLADGPVTVTGTASCTSETISGIDISLDGGTEWLPVPTPPGGWGLNKTTWSCAFILSEGEYGASVRLRGQNGLIAGATDSIVLHVDGTAPHTASDAVAYYASSATISLVASDTTGGSGVAHTYYVLNGAPTLESSTVQVSGAGTYTLGFWSVDAAGNPETTHTVTFTVIGKPNGNGTPSTPASIATLKHGKSFTTYGYIIKHTAGTYPVTLQFYRYQSGHWVLRKSITAKASTIVTPSTTFSKYSRSSSVPYSGKWRVRARHKVGSKYLYSGYRTFTAS